MKQLIIIFTSIVLGVYIFGIIAGDAGSIKEASQSIMEKQIEQQKQIP